MASVYLNPPPQRDHSHHRHPFQLDHHDHISHLQQLLPYSSSSSSSSHDQVREATAAIYLNLTADQRMMELEESQRDHLQKVDQCSADGRSSNVESPPIQASKMITMNNNISNSNLPLRKREIAEIRSASIDISSSSSSTSAKWTASKMRLMQKMISKNNTTESADDDQDQHKQQQLHENGSNNNTSNSNAIRVCSDCNTTTTPLWRSGPRGPKSLCNACGIRKRKARRALEAAAAGGGGNGSTATATTTTTTTSTTDQSSFTKIKLQIKKPRTSHVMSTHHHHHQQQQQQQQQLNKQQSESDLENQQQQQQQRYDDENQSQGKLFFQGFGVGNDSALKHACTQDVAEAAHLLMELSSGASIHTY